MVCLEWTGFRSLWAERIYQKRTGCNRLSLCVAWPLVLRLRFWWWRTRGSQRTCPVAAYSNQNTGVSLEGCRTVTWAILFSPESWRSSETWNWVPALPWVTRAMFISPYHGHWYKFSWGCCRTLAQRSNCAAGPSWIGILRRIALRPCFLWKKVVSYVPREKGRKPWMFGLVLLHAARWLARWWPRRVKFPPSYLPLLV